MMMMDLLWYLDALKTHAAESLHSREYAGSTDQGDLRVTHAKYDESNNKLRIGFCRFTVIPGGYWSYQKIPALVALQEGWRHVAFEHRKTSLPGSLARRAKKIKLSASVLGVAIIIRWSRRDPQQDR